MLFHLFVFSSHMNCSIHSYSACKLTIRMIHVHIVMRYHSYAAMQYLPRMRGVKQLVLSVCQFVSLSVCQSGEKCLNLNLHRVKQFPNLTVALTL